MIEPRRSITERKRPKNRQKKRPKLARGVQKLSVMRFLRQADVGTRTRDPLLTMEVLYQLSYVGAKPES